MQVTSSSNNNIQPNSAPQAVQENKTAQAKPSQEPGDKVNLSQEAQKQLKAEQTDPKQKIANLENELFNLYDKALAKTPAAELESTQDKQLNQLIAQQEYKAVDKLSPEQKQSYNKMADDFANLYKSLPGGDKLVAELQKIKNPLERIDKMFEATANMPVSEAFLAKEEQLFSNLDKASEKLNVNFSPEQQQQLDSLLKQSEDNFNQQISQGLDDKQKTRVAQLNQMLDQLYQQQA